MQRPYDIENIDNVRYKPNSGKLEMEFPLDEHEQNFDVEAAPNLRIERRLLVSTETHVREGYCVAVMQEGALHVTPINAVYQMRPSLAHLDAADERKREQEKVNDAEANARRQQVGKLHSNARHFHPVSPILHKNVG